METNSLLDEAEALVGKQEVVTEEQPVTSEDIQEVSFEGYKFTDNPFEIDSLFEQCYGVSNASETFRNLYIKEGDETVDIRASLHRFSPAVFVQVASESLEETKQFLSDMFGMGAVKENIEVAEPEVAVFESEVTSLGTATWSDTAEEPVIARIFFDNADIDMVQTPNGMITREDYDSFEIKEELERELSFDRLSAQLQDWRDKYGLKVAKEHRIAVQKAEQRLKEKKESVQESIKRLRAKVSADTEQ